MRALMQLVAKIDDLGKPAWIALMIVSFILFWPAGLAILLYLIWSGRMAFWKDAGRGYVAQGRRYGCGWHRGFHYTPPSGNRAFDEYRAEALRRLEEEQKEFTEFLERLRKARDQQEFDQFMAERRNRPQGSPEAPEPKPAG
jgi:uncharacterized protein DUF2852